MGGSSISASVISVVLGCSVFYFLMMLGLACNTSPPGNAEERKKERMKRKLRMATFGQIKLILNFLQILSSTTQTMSSVPWPSNFRSFTTGIDFVNMDMMNAFVVSDCHLSVPPLDRFLLHMLIPPLLISAFLGAFVSVSLCCPKSSLCKKNRTDEEMKERERRFDRDGDGVTTSKEIVQGIRHIRRMSTVKALILLMLQHLNGTVLQIVH